MKSLRLKVHEANIASTKANEFKDLMDDDLKETMTASKVIHEVLRIALPKAKIDKYGNIVVDTAA